MKKTIAFLSITLMSLIGFSTTSMALTLLNFESNAFVSVKSVNAIPIITAAQSFSINENSVNGSVVGTVVATDLDGGTIFSNWTITGGNTNNAFSISASTGIISVNNSTELNRELVSSFNLMITVSDGINTSAPQVVVVTLDDVNDVVPVVTPNQTLHVTEQSPNGTTVGTVLATDGDVTATSFQNWTLTAGNSQGFFYVNSGTGVIMVVDNTGLDAAINQIFTLTFTVSDGINTSLPQTVTIIVSQINDENPVITPSQSFVVNENSANGTVVGQVLATDQDYGTIFQGWSIFSGNTNNAFAINPTTGEIIVNNSLILDYESIPSFSLIVQVSDGLHNVSGLVTVNLNNLAEAAVVTTQAVSDVSHNTATGNGTIVNLGSPNPTEHGVCWNTTGNPTVSDNKTTQGVISTTGAFVSSITSLNPSTLYYVRAYATNGTTTYGDEVSFTTSPTPITIAFNTTSSNGLETTSSANLQVNLSEVSAQNVTVDFTVTGTATGNGVDYTLANGTLTINAGSLNNNITIANIVSDLNVEGPETVVVTLSNPTNAILGTNTVYTYTINDDLTTVSDIAKSNVSIYPNPFTSKIYFDHLSNNISSVIINDLLGNTLLKQENVSDNSISVSDLSSGVYLLVIVFDNGEKQMVKMVKE
jgi:hypothetical protein